MCKPFTRSTVRELAATPSEVHALIEALDRIPRRELPNGADRLALTRAIVAGDVDALYRPMGASAHNVCIARLAPDIDPRMTVAQWVACVRAGVRPLDVIVSAHRARVSVGEALAALSSEVSSEVSSEDEGGR